MRMEAFSAFGTDSFFRYCAFFAGVSAMSIASPRFNYEDEKQREVAGRR